MLSGLGKADREFTYTKLGPATKEGHNNEDRLTTNH